MFKELEMEMAVIGVIAAAIELEESENGAMTEDQRNFFALGVTYGLEVLDV